MDRLPCFLLLVASLVGGACGCKDKSASPRSESSDAAAPPSVFSEVDASHLEDDAKRALAEITTLETTKDVTCWTSFRQLDAFISSKEYSNFAVLSKITATKALVRAAWERASRASRAERLSADDFKALKVQEPRSQDRDRLAQFATEKLRMKAYTDYRTTSEHWRVLLSVIEEEMLAGPSTPLKALTQEGLTELADLGTKLSLVLLQRSSELAQEERTPFIEAEHVKRAHAEIAEKNALRNTARAARAPGEDTRKRLASLTKGLVEGKVKALLTYNKSSGSLLGDINRVAKVPVADDGLDAMMKDLQSFAHFVAAGHEPMQADNFLSDGQFAPTKLPAKPYVDAGFAATATLQLFPHLILPNGDLSLRFEANPAWAGRKDRKAFEVTLRDYEQNAIRDTAIHWIVMDQVYKERPFAMDPFAAEYVSEVVSMMATAYLRRAEALATESKQREIHAGIVGRVRDKQFVQVMPKPSSPTSWTPEQEAKKRTVLAKYTTLFKNVTARSGLRSTTPGPGKEAGDGGPPPAESMSHGIQKVMGSGVAIGDIDKDGYPDLFVAEDGDARLYSNKGKDGPGTFVDVTEASGIPIGIGDAKQVLFFDMEGDGDLDLLVLRSDHPSMIFRNDGGRFVDVTEAVGFKPHGHGAHTATVFDYDGDGDLDMYVGYYGSDETNRKGSEARNLPSMDGKNGTPHQLWKRGADGRYSEVGREAGVADTGWTLAASGFDYDNDGKPDIFLANDFGPDLLYHNRGDGTFEDVSKITRTDDNGSGMNASAVDINGDGFLDFYVTNIDMFSKNVKVVYPTDKSTLTSLDEQLATTFQYISGNKLYVNPGAKAGHSAFRAEENTRFEPGDRGWGWAALFFDYENDGDDDMFLSNGWIDGSTAANQKKQMFINDNGFFYLAPPTSPEAVPSNGRAAIAFDMDRDGDLDLLLLNFRQPPVLLENTQSFGNHWIQLRLRAAAPNAYAIGTRVTAKADKRTITREVSCGSGYLGQDDDVVSFGVGAAKEADVTLRWPNGKTQTIPRVPVDKITDVTQP